MAAKTYVVDSDIEEVSYSSSSSETEEETFVYNGEGIRPYMYEPIKPRSHKEKTSTESEEHGVSLMCDEDSTAAAQRLGTTEWCSCGKCVEMTNPAECLCCREVGPALHRIEEGQKQCITELDGFTANCLNIHVLETSFYEFLAIEHGPLGEDEDLHKLYRHVAYRRFTRYIWKVLGPKVRKVIPACAVSAIRRQFPSENYTNFKYPRP